MEHSILKTAEYTFFSSARGTFATIELILGHKTGLNIYKKTKIIPRIFPNHNAIKLEANRKEIYENTTNTWKLNNLLLNNQRVKEETKEEIK